MPVGDRENWPAVGVPSRPRAFAQSAVRGFDRLSAVDAGRRPALQAVRALLRSRRYAVSTASRRSMPVGDRRSRPSPRFCAVGGTRFLPPLGGRCRSETGVPSRPRAFAQSAVRGFYRLSAVDAGRRPALRAVARAFAQSAVRGFDRLPAVDAGRRPALQAVPRDGLDLPRRDHRAVRGGGGLSRLRTKAARTEDRDPGEPGHCQKILIAVHQDVRLPHLRRLQHFVVSRRYAVSHPRSRRSRCRSETARSSRQKSRSHHPACVRIELRLQQTGPKYVKRLVRKQQDPAPASDRIDCGTRRTLRPECRAAPSHWCREQPAQLSSARSSLKTAGVRALADRLLGGRMHRSETGRSQAVAAKALVLRSWTSRR